ncbi:hypothetical protein AA313_de0202432 [Arthrobotrys entomopaga]|nr:hypothetical protein AA313_de0202432 [Arthrobotrys entomopaga]
MNPRHDDLSHLKGGNAPTFDITIDTLTKSSTPIESKVDLREPQTTVETEDQKILRKRIDWTILPILLICYFLLFTNRTNVQLVYTSNHYGFKASSTNPTVYESNFSSTDYAVVQFVFAISYALPEPLWNVLLRRLGPKFWIAPALFFSGLIAIFCALVKDWKGLAGLRFLIGIPLGAIFPGCLYYLTCWYPRRRLGLPISMFYSGASLGSALANLLNSAILKIHTGKQFGLFSKPNPLEGTFGTDWVTIIWGLVTIIASVIIFFTIPDFPDEDDKILKSEADRAVFRAWYVAGDVTRDISEQYRPHAWKQAVTDIKTFLFLVIQISTVVARDGLAILLRQIAINMALKLSNIPSGAHPVCQTLTFSGLTESDLEYITKCPQGTIQTLLYAPPVALAFFATIAVGICSDRTNQRGYYLMTFSLFSICGFAMLLATENPAAQYVAAFLAFAGTWVCGALAWVWHANNCEGLYKRAIVIGITVGSINLVSGLTVPATVILYPSENGVSRAGSAYFLGMVCIHLCSSAFMRFYLLDQNRKKRALGSQPHDATQDSRPGGLPIEDKGDLRCVSLYQFTVNS